MKNPLEARKAMMGYREFGFVTSHCGLCAQCKPEGQRDRRCSKGGFFVRTNSGCNHFEARDKVVIGPTDI